MKIIYIVLCLLIANNISAQPDKEDFIVGASEEKVLRIGLVDCITYVVKNNSEVKIQRLEPQIAEQDIRIARSEFYPVLGLNYYLADNEKLQTIPFLTGTDTLNTRSIDFNTELTGKLFLGTQYKAEFINNWLKTNSIYQSPNPAYESQARLTITQPLFKGAGATVNRANIILANNSKQMSDLELAGQLMASITQAQEAYYNYLFAIENNKIVQLSLKRAEELKNIIEERYKQGMASSVDLLEAEAAVSSRIQAKIEVESNMGNTQDQLKLITNLVSDPELWNAEIELIDQPGFTPLETKSLTGFTEAKTNLAESLVTAFDNRPDYKSAKIGLENQDILVKVAQNSLWPTVDMVGSIGVNGLGGDYDEDWDKLTSGDYQQWSAGVKFSYPWLNVGGRAGYEKTKMEKLQALIAFKNLEQGIILEVRNIVRAVDTSYRKLMAAAKVREAQRKNYEAQRKRYMAGQISTHELLQHEENLDEAEVGYISALIDYNIAIAKLDEAEGLTLVKNNVQIE